MADGFSRNQALKRLNAEAGARGVLTADRGKHRLRIAAERPVVGADNLDLFRNADAALPQCLQGGKRQRVGRSGQPIPVRLRIECAQEPGRQRGGVVAAERPDVFRAQGASALRQRIAKAAEPPLPAIKILPFLLSEDITI